MAKQNMSVAIEVTVSWEGNPLATTLAREGALSIGPNLGAWFLMPLATNHELLCSDGEGWTLAVPDGAQAVATRNGDLLSIENGKVAMSAHTVAEVRLERFTFYLRATQAERVSMRKPALDYKAMRWVAAAVAVHGILLGVFSMMPPQAAALNLDQSGDEARYLQVHLDAIARPEPIVVPTAGQQGGSANDAPESGARGGGQSDTIATPGGGGVDHPHGGRPRPTFVVPSADRAGILAVLEGGEALTFGSESSPYTATSAQQGPGGPGSQLAWMLPGGPGVGGGMDFHGTGHGACNPATERCGEGTIDVDGLDTGVRGNVPDPQLHREPGHSPPHIRTPDASTTGALNPEDVRRVIRRHVAEVRFCYEQGLQSRPDLEGRVAVQFIIAPDGSVRTAGISENSVDARVGSCVSDAVRRWTFPSASMSTGVSYPFVMQPGS